MPILIKSSNGQRSCKLLNNAAPKQSNTIQDLIEALKGLTFKFEVKITGITATDGGEESPAMLDKVMGDSTEAQARAPNEDLVQKLKLELEQMPDPKVEQKQIQVPLNNGTKIPPEQKVSALAKPDNAHNPSVIVRYDQPANKNSVPTPSLKVAPKPQPKLMRGELKIGDVKATYCIAADDKCKPPVGYVAYDDEKLLELVRAIDNITTDIEASPRPTTVEVGSIVLTKSVDDNKWYRAIIEKIEGDNVYVYFFDWGLREKVTLARIRHILYPDIGMSKFPACALKLRFVNTSPELIDQALSCEVNFRMLIDFYDDASECYEVTVLDLVVS